MRCSKIVNIIPSLITFSKQKKNIKSHLKKIANKIEEYLHSHYYFIEFKSINLYLNSN